MSSNMGSEVPSALMTMRDLGQMLNLSARSVRRLRRANLLPEPVKLGGTIRWRREVIDQWIRHGCLPPKEPAEQIRDDNSSVVTEFWYFVCLRCNGKWFAPKAKFECPRCGQVSVSAERRIPPWEQALILPKD
ncbi:helix-turn-helix domain-containing protein [bacterium]|nr:helix-turn-helix domain-containing protein [bacterium]